MTLDLKRKQRQLESEEGSDDEEEEEDGSQSEEAEKGEDGEEEEEGEGTRVGWPRGEGGMAEKGQLQGEGKLPKQGQPDGDKNGEGSKLPPAQAPLSVLALLSSAEALDFYLFCCCQIAYPSSMCVLFPDTEDAAPLVRSASALDAVRAIFRYSAVGGGIP